VVCLLAAALVVGVALTVDAAFSWAGMNVESSDLWVWREGGRLVLEGQPLYDIRFGPGYWTYPPFGAVVMMPLALVPVDALMPLAVLVNLVGVLGIVALSFRGVLDRAASTLERGVLLAGLAVVSIALFPVADTFALGQLGIVLTFACLLDAVVLARRGSRWQGVIVGIAAAVKLTPALFLVYYVVTRQWRGAITGAGTMLGCWVMAAVLLPNDTRTWLERRIAFRTNEQIGGHGDSLANQSLRGMVDGLPSGVVTPAWIVLVVPVLLIGLWTVRRAYAAGDLLTAAAVVGLVSVLVSPISWHHHAVWVVPALGALVGTGRRRVDLVVAAAAALLLMPHPLTGYGSLDMYAMTYLLILGALAVRERTRRAGADPRQELSASPERYQSEVYEQVMYTGAVGRFSRLAHRAMERPFRRCSSGDVLEVGAGAGQHAPYVARFDSYLETDIAVPTEEMTVRMLPAGTVERRHLDAQDLGVLPDNSFDRVIATCLLAHLDDPATALREWRRVTRPGGSVTVYLPTEPGMLLRMARRVVMVPKSRQFDQDHEATVYREHRNHYPGMRRAVQEAFSGDEVTFRRYPVRFLGWNAALFDVAHVRLST
jgi:alpha-1,2-mannosyltransferase